MAPVNNRFYIKVFLINLIILVTLESYISVNVAVVTGANKGIGYAIVQGLYERFDGPVYLTARDEKRGLAAKESLFELGYHPKFHLLDITDPTSVEKLRDYLLKQYGGLDVLVNNAAIAFKTNPKDPLETKNQIRETMQVNYFALRDTCNVLFSILRPHARVVNLSGPIGHLSRIPGKHLREILASPDLTEEKLSSLMTEFIEAAENGTHRQEGWPDWAYAVSKVGVSALSRIQQREFLKDKNRPDIIVNHVSPGFVNTDMTNHKGPMTVDEGAEAPVRMALLEENCTKPKGDFVWHTQEIVDWVNGPLPRI